jgi:hypothetical protein
MRKVWPWENAEWLPLSNGIEVLAVTVPPYAYADVHAMAPPAPDRMVEVESAAGKELVRALPGTPEWEKYVADRRKWEALLHQRTGAFRLDYGTIGWKYPDSEEPVDMPPDEWEPPEVMQRWGIEQGMRKDDPTLRRTAFIKYVLIGTEEDEDTLSEKWDAPKPPSKKEVQDAMVPSISGEETAPQ